MGEGVEEWAAAERTRRAEKKRRRPTFATEETGEEEAFRKDCNLACVARQFPLHFRQKVAESDFLVLSDYTENETVQKSREKKMCKKSGPDSQKAGTSY